MNSFSVAIEGIDGVGKTTLIRKLEPLLHNLFKTKVIQAPGQTDAGQVIRRLVKNKDIPLSSKAQAHLFIADMWNTYNLEIEPYLSDSWLFLYDRCFLSTMVYQDLSIRYLNTHLKLFPPAPNLIIYLDCERSVESAEERDRFDHKDMKYFSALKSRYRNLLEILNGPYRVSCITTSNRDPFFIKDLILEQYHASKEKQEGQRPRI